ncbi:MAG: hypothetical protein ACFE9N_04325 [Promethearchaeota archaeon]
MYNALKKYNNKLYTGMRVGDSHQWNYMDGKWYETKKEPDKWTFNFESLKTRTNPAPINTGASINTKFHWYIIADQIATKIDQNSYTTSMTGIKFKIGHKRPYWKTFSYNYPDQSSYKERIIKILEGVLNNLKNSKF